MELNSKLGIMKTFRQGLEKRKKNQTQMDTDLVNKKKEACTENISMSVVDEDILEENLPRTVNYDLLMKVKIDEHQFLLDGYLRKKGIAFLVGTNDCGKSYFALDFARSICSNEKTFLGIPIYPKHNSVLFVSTEDSAEDHKTRFQMMNPAKLENIKNLRFTYDIENLITYIDTELSSNPADAVILDTFGDLFLRNLNSSIDVRQFLMQFKELAKKHHCLFLFIHHIGKRREDSETPNKNDILGSEGIISASRSLLNLRKNKDGKRCLTMTKGNYSPDTEKNKGLLLDFDPFNGFQADGTIIDFNQTQNKQSKTGDSSIVAEVKVLYNQNKTCRAISEELKLKGYNVSKSSVNEIIKKHILSNYKNTKDNGQNGQQEAA